MSDHAARHEPGAATWHCRCGHVEEYTTALEMVEAFKQHVQDERKAQTYDP